MKPYIIKEHPFAVYVGRCHYHAIINEVIPYNKSNHVWWLGIGVKSITDKQNEYVTNYWFKEHDRYHKRRKT